MGRVLWHAVARCGTLWHAARGVLSRRGTSDGCMYEGRERMGCHAPSLAALAVDAVDAVDVDAVELRHKLWIHVDPFSYLCDIL